MYLLLAASLLAAPAEAASADTTTTVFDGSTSCDAPFPGLEICQTLDGVAHDTATGRGRFIYVFNGDRNFELIVGGVVLFSVDQVDTHVVSHYTDDPDTGFAENVYHFKSCATLDGGSTYFHYDYNWASEELRYDHSEAVDSCD